MARADATVRNPVTDTRTGILRAVLRVIGTEGIGGVTNRRIAKEAGVSLGSITYHFETQNDLLRESLLLFVHEETARLRAIAEAPRDEMSVEQVAELVEQVAKTCGQEGIAPLELYLHAGRDPQLRDAAAECFAAYDAIAVTVLTGLGVPEPERRAGPVVALIAGMQLRQLSTGTTGTTGLAQALVRLSEFLP